MHPLLDTKLRRGDTDCPPGKQFFRCARNNFRGCCSTDPCALPNCPDTADDSSPSTRIESPTKTSKATTVTTPTTPTATETDSVISSSIVTVTRSEFSGQSGPTTLASSTSPSPSSTSTSVGASQSTSGTSLSSGAIAGVIVSIIAVLAALIIAFFLIQKRRKNKIIGHGPLANNTGEDTPELGEKYGDSQTIGTPAELSPFVPFGEGRLDQSYSSDSPSFTVTTPELDGGTGTAISELPAQATPSGLGLSHGGQLEEARKVSSFTDPRATLNSTLDDSGHPVSVNYWSHYGTPSGHKDP